MSVYFQMKNTAKREAIHFDGMQITLRELKKQIIALKKFSGEDAYENLHVSTKAGREYKQDDELIPRNATVVVSRLLSKSRPRPVVPKPKPSDAASAGASTSGSSVASLFKDLAKKRKKKKKAVIKKKLVAEAVAAAAAEAAAALLPKQLDSVVPAAPAPPPPAPNQGFAHPPPQPINGHAAQGHFFPPQPSMNSESSSVGFGIPPTGPQAVGRPANRNGERGAAPRFQPGPPVVVPRWFYYPPAFIQNPKLMPKDVFERWQSQAAQVRQSKTHRQGQNSNGGTRGTRKGDSSSRGRIDVAADEKSHRSRSKDSPPRSKVPRRSRSRSRSRSRERRSRSHSHGDNAGRDRSSGSRHAEDRSRRQESSSRRSSSQSQRRSRQLERSRSRSRDRDRRDRSSEHGRRSSSRSRGRRDHVSRRGRRSSSRDRSSKSRSRRSASPRRQRRSSGRHSDARTEGRQREPSPRRKTRRSRSRDRDRSHRKCDDGDNDDDDHWNPSGVPEYEEAEAESPTKTQASTTKDNPPTANEGDTAAKAEVAEASPKKDVDLRDILVSMRKGSKMSSSEKVAHPKSKNAQKTKLNHRRKVSLGSANEAGIRITIKSRTNDNSESSGKERKRKRKRSGGKKKKKN